MPVGAVASVATVESHAVPPACLQSARLRPADPDVLKLYEPVAIVVIAEPKAAVVVAWSASSAAVGHSTMPEYTEGAELTTCSLKNRR